MDFAHYWFQEEPGGDTGIGNSLRFRGNQFLTYNGSIGSGQEVTLSCWVKLGALGTANREIFAAGTGTPNNATLYFSNNDQLCLFANTNNTTLVDIRTTAVFRDLSAWYHIVVQVNTNAQIYNLFVNGVNTAWSGSTNYPIGNTWWWGNNFNYVGAGFYGYFDGYLSEFHYDHSGLIAPTEFGQSNANGVWTPKPYINSTLYLDFSDPAGIGADRSGNGNNFTPNGFELADTDSELYDHMEDSPDHNASTLNPLVPPATGAYEDLLWGNLNGGCTSSSTAFLQAFYQNTAFKVPDTGKYFFAYHNYGNSVTADRFFGVNLRPTPDAFPDDRIPVPSAGVYSLMRFGAKYRYYPGQDGSQDLIDLSGQPGAGEPHGTAVMAYDANTGNVWCGMAFPPGHTDFNNGAITWYQSDATVGGDPVAGTDPTFTVTGDQYLAYTNIRRGTSGNVGVNAVVLGSSTTQADALVQRPNGFKYLDTASMPAAPIRRGRDHFQVITAPGVGYLIYPELVGKTTEALDTAGTSEYSPFTGFGQNGSYVLDTFETRSRLIFNNATGWQSVLNRVFLSSDGVNWVENSVGITLPSNGTVDFTPDTPARFFRFSWVGTDGSAGTAGFGNIFAQDDVSPILSYSKAAFPNGLWWIKDRVNNNQHQLVDSVRGQVGGNWQALRCPTASGNVNYTAPAGNSVAWCWNFNAADPTVNGFDIQTYTGDGDPNRTVNHNLGAPPDMYMTWKTSNVEDCAVFLPEFLGRQTAPLNLNALTLNADIGVFATGAVDPTATTFGTGNSGPSNHAGQDYIAYLWRAIPGYSAFGSYTGNSDMSGPFVYTGFRPSFLLIKNASIGNWFIYDTTRNVNNPTDQVLFTDLTQGEESQAAANIDILSNGFKIRGTGDGVNFNGVQYIYMTLAENPYGGSNVSPANAR